MTQINAKRIITNHTYQTIPILAPFLKNRVDYEQEQATCQIR